MFLRRFLISLHYYWLTGVFRHVSNSKYSYKTIYKFSDSNILFAYNHPGFSDFETLGDSDEEYIDG